MVARCTAQDRLVGDGKRRPEVLYLPTFWFAAGGSAQVSRLIAVGCHYTS